MKTKEITLTQAMKHDTDPLNSWEAAGNLWPDLETAFEYCDAHGEAVLMWRGSKPSAAQLMRNLLDVVVEQALDYDTQWGWAAVLDAGGYPDSCVLNDPDGNFASALYSACEVALEHFDPEVSPRHETALQITLTPEVERIMSRPKSERWALAREYDETNRQTPEAP